MYRAPHVRTLSVAGRHWICNVRVPAGVLEMTGAGMGGAVRSMRRFTKAVAVVAALAAGCTSSPSSALHSHLAQCAAYDLLLRLAAPLPSMTGEHAVLYTLANRGPAACTVRGYPQVTLYGARGWVLPFRYADGGGAYVTARPPVTVVLAHGGMAYVLAAKYRCDLGIAQNVATMRLALPAAGGQVFSSRQPVRVSGPPGLSYCRGGPRDPGQLVTISPIEETRRAASSPDHGPGQRGRLFSPRPCPQCRHRAASGQESASGRDPLNASAMPWPAGLCGGAVPMLGLACWAGGEHNVVPDRR